MCGGQCMACTRILRHFKESKEQCRPADLTHPHIKLGQRWGGTPLLELRGEAENWLECGNLCYLHPGYPNINIHTDPHKAAQSGLFNYKSI